MYSRVKTKLAVMSLFVFAGLFFPSSGYPHGGEAHYRTNIITNIVNTATGEVLDTSKNMAVQTAIEGPKPEALHILTVILGIITFSLLTLNIVIGFLRWKKILPWKMKAHKYIGLATWITAVIHAALVLFF